LHQNSLQGKLKVEYFNVRYSYTFAQAAFEFPSCDLVSFVVKSFFARERRRDLQSHAFASDNHFMPEDRREDLNRRGPDAAESASGPFRHGSMVVVTLGNPREKTWGMVLSLSPQGLSLSGIELASFEDFVLMVKEEEGFSPAVIFFPMHRIERIELDFPDGNLPSLSQRFTAKTGLDPAVFLRCIHSQQAAENDPA
jgi:hypothetical protein